MAHKLSLYLGSRPVQQRRRKLGPQRAQVVEEQIQALLEAGFIKEVKYPAWLANVVLVKKPNEYAGDQEEASTTWKLYVDGFSNKIGSGAGIILVNQEKTQIEVSLKFEFPASNNQAEYEALIAGLKLAEEVGATKVVVFSDSQVVTSQIYGEYQAKDPNIKRSHSAEIEKIVKTVTKILSPRPSSSLSNDIVVGMEFSLQELGKLLVLDSDDDVRVVGICGMGGIGKTTLACRLYEKISHQYDVSCFMDDVSKTYRDCGSLGMKKQLLCPAFMEEDSPICNILMADNLIQNMLHYRKVLIVLDNVDQRIQLEKLALKREWLGRGSRIIIVSRDEHILREYGADHVYKVQLLNDENALQLFCRKSFKCNHVAKDYESLTDSALAYANGLPLAIKVLGSFLFGRDVSEWSSALVRLKETPTKDIMDVLRISFDGLEDDEKDIFLDIACFFPNDIEKYVKDILRIRGFHPDNGIKVLIEKSLITRDRWKITMHDLLRDLGRSIVREKSPKKPRKWSRLWNHKDLSNVLRENKVKIVI
nr:disease resistance protein RPP2B-like [Arachis hypogaea]